MTVRISKLVRCVEDHGPGLRIAAILGCESLRVDLSGCYDAFSKRLTVGIEIVSYSAEAVKGEPGDDFSCLGMHRPC